MGLVNIAVILTRGYCFVNQTQHNSNPGRGPTFPPPSRSLLWHFSRLHECHSHPFSPS